jgi:hypothetical protein
MEVKVPRWGKKFEIFLETGFEGAKMERFLGTVNLNSLGFAMNVKRLIGIFKSIYVRIE